MLILALVAILMGSGLAIQTAINSRLRMYVTSPYLSSAISFIVGAVFLLVLTLLSGQSPLISSTIITSNPWWLWFGGVVGSIALTANVLLFPRLGSIQTSVLPVFGQIIMGMVIDQFGLFQSPQLGMTSTKVVGVVLVTVGMLLATGIIRNRVKVISEINTSRVGRIGWQLFGIVAGALTSIQTAINGHLGAVLRSPMHAAMISFTIGAIILVIVTLSIRVPVRQNLMIAFNSGIGNWWIWIGGILGGSYVFAGSWLVPQIGTGQVVVIALFGQLLFSALIDQFGYFGSHVNRISMIRVIGLVILFIGTLITHFM